MLFVLAELCNARAHRMLRDLRPLGTKTRVIPRGFLFERVSSPHYLFEILSWVGFALVTQTWAARAFLVVAVPAFWGPGRTLGTPLTGKSFDGQEGREKVPGLASRVDSRRVLRPNAHGAGGGSRLQRFFERQADARHYRPDRPALHRLCRALEIEHRPTLGVVGHLREARHQVAVKNAASFRP